MVLSYQVGERALAETPILSAQRSRSTAGSSACWEAAQRICGTELMIGAGKFTFPGYGKESCKRAKIFRNAAPLAQLLASGASEAGHQHGGG